jgi:hypothetical protein
MPWPRETGSTRTDSSPTCTVPRREAPWPPSPYDAVNGTSYTDASAIGVTTIETVTRLGMHNDASFIIADETDL